MRARVLGGLIAALGLLVLLTPWFIFPVCGIGSPGVHACHGTLKAETVLGAVIVVVGVIPLLWPGRKSGLTASVLSIISAALVILFPTAITGLCKMPTMACRVGTLPALVILGILLAVTGAAGTLLCRRMT